MSLTDTGPPIDHDRSNGSVAGYAVKLPVFEGPLDLLLHLIRQNEVEITEIPIAHISAQYLEYLEVMQQLDLDVASEYLVMAATLAHIKSRMLLPPEQEEEDEEEIDPRAELVARLLEYQRYKEVAEALGKRRLLDRDIFDANGMGPEEVPESEREIEVGLFELIEAFRLMLKNADRVETRVHHVETEPVTVRERMITIMQSLGKGQIVEFNQVFLMADGGVPTRSVLVASFLAILELARLSALAIFQSAGDDGEPCGPIRLRANETVQDVSWDDRITELM